MKKLLLFLTVACLYTAVTGQNPKQSAKDTLLKELAENGCQCVDSINIYNKSKDEVSEEISKCIDKQTGAYQLAAKLMQVDDLKEDAKEKDGKKQINLTINMNKNSEDYKSYYYELERYMVDNCPSLKEKIASNEKQNEKSFSKNPKALKFYSKGVDESKAGHTEKAIKYFKRALDEDPEFAFAWDNLGLNYRRLDDYDKAIEAYKKSLEIDPNGLMPLQNIAVAYQYKKEYQNALDAYETLAGIDKNNPEIYYGIGHIYTYSLSDLEKGLDYMCKAYNLYVEQKSPYRTDAEKVINSIYSDMKKQGKEDTFREILKSNQIKWE